MVDLSGVTTSTGEGFQIKPEEDLSGTSTVSDKPSTQSPGSSIEKSQQEDDAKNSVLPYVPSIAFPKDLTPQEAQNIIRELGMSFASFKAELVSAMWESWHKANIAIEQSGQIADQRKELQAQFLEGNQLYSERQEMELIGGMIAQHLLNGAALQMLLGKDKDFLDRLKAEKDFVNNAVAFVTKALDDPSFNSDLRVYIMGRLDQMDMSQAAKEALADKWIQSTRVTIAYSALGPVLRTDTTADGKQGSYDQGVGRLREIFEQDIASLKEIMGDDEFVEFMDNLSRRASLYGQNAAGMATSYILYLSPDTSDEVEANRREADPA